MQKPESAEVRRRSANDSEGLQSGFSIDRLREMEQEREAVSGQHKRQTSCLLRYSGGCGDSAVNVAH